MRKALIGLIMAATVLSPIAAQAQESRSERGDRFERGQRGDRPTRSEPRRSGGENRAQRQQARQPQQAPQRQQARQHQAPPAEPVQVETRRQARQSGATTQRHRGERRDVGARQSAYPQVWQGDPNDPRRRHYEQLERRNQYRHGTSEQREQVRREVRQERRDDGRNWRGDRRDSSRDWRRDWNRQTWRSDRRYDWRDWRYRNRHTYRLPTYYSPYRHHRYSRFSIGFHLQPLFYSQRYWISDPWYYRLPPAPPGTRWVRYYNDVLLVDTWSGEVIDVIYDFFW